MHLYVSNMTAAKEVEHLSSVNKKLNRMNMYTTLISAMSIGMALSFAGLSLRLNSVIASLTSEQTPADVLEILSIGPWFPVILMVIGVCLLLIVAPIIAVLMFWKQFRS